ARRPDPGAFAREPGQARPGAENQGARNLRLGPQSYPATTISPPGCGCRTTPKAPAILLGPVAVRVTIPVPPPNPLVGSGSVSSEPFALYRSRASRSPRPASAFPATTILLSGCTATAKPLSKALMLVVTYPFGLPKPVVSSEPSVL